MADFSVAVRHADGSTERYQILDAADWQQARNYVFANVHPRPRVVLVAERVAVQDDPLLKPAA